MEKAKCWCKTVGTCVVLAIICTDISPVNAQGMTWTSKGPAVACRTQEILERLEQLQFDGDAAALKKFSLAALATRACIVLEKGETVYGRFESVCSGLLRIRKKGELEEYIARSGNFDWDQRHQK